MQKRAAGAEAVAGAGAEEDAGLAVGGDDDQAVGGVAPRHRAEMFLADGELHRDGGQRVGGEVDDRGKFRQCGATSRRFVSG